MQHPVIYARITLKISSGAILIIFSILLPHISPVVTLEQGAQRTARGEFKDSSHGPLTILPTQS